MLGVLAAAVLLGLLGQQAAGERLSVTVVVVLATTENAPVDPKLAELAKEVRKRDPKLNGFRRGATETRSIPVGEAHTFKLVEKQELKVKVERGRDANGWVSLTIKPPALGEVTYACVCGKFFLILTPHTTKKGEQLIVAVMAKPCTAKK